MCNQPNDRYCLAPFIQMLYLHVQEAVREFQEVKK